MCPTESSGRSVVAKSGVRPSDRRGTPSTWARWQSMFDDMTLREDKMRSVLGMADAEDAITEAITISSLRGDCGDIALIGVGTAARHRSVSWTTILALSDVKGAMTAAESVLKTSWITCNACLRQA